LGKGSDLIALIIIVVVVVFVGLPYLNSLTSQKSERSTPTYPTHSSSTPSTTPSKPSTSQRPDPVIVSHRLSKWFGEATVHYSVRNNGGAGYVSASIDLEVQYEDQHGLTRSYVKTRSENFYVGSGQTIDRNVEFSLSSGEKAIGHGIDIW
jgi:hypothetical protein